MSGLKYDLIIYLCLFLAFVCVIYSLVNTSYSYEEKDNKKDLVEVQEIVEIPEGIEQIEPEDLSNSSVRSIIDHYLDMIIDQSECSEVLSYDIIKTWPEYETIDASYDKTIVEGYYQYKAQIKIKGTNVKLPSEKNAELSTGEYTVVDLIFGILDSELQNGYVVKSVSVA